jgi:hypothetical protein
MGLFRIPFFDFETRVFIFNIGQKIQARFFIFPAA